ncbi:MAG TPA: hypothetical protein VHJ77_01630 [Vicinamibacterales bacterium]|nr:hypothetical protein [Vicinamibacterales bacterium]
MLRSSASAAAVCVALAGVTAQAQDPGLPLRITSWAVNMSNIGTGANAIVDITIDRWSTDAERQGLITTFFEKGPEKLLDALQDTKPVGRIRLPNTLGYDLRFARHHPMEDGGERYVIITDRRIGFAEARNQPRTIDYPFTLIEIRVAKDGKGEGKMSVATKISYNKKQNTVELENYSSEPVRLTNVKVEKK